MKERATAERSQPGPAIPDRILICPDCYGMVQERQAIRDLTPYGIFLECPDCAVGSPAAEWKEGTHS
jgi:hypothetical protein